MSPAPGPTSPMPDGGGPLSNQVVSDAFTNPALTFNDARDDAVSSASGTKTCARCGRHFESNELAPPSLSEDSFSNVEPSPSSVAFAAESSTSILATASGSSTAADSMALDEDGHQICSSCALTRSSDLRLNNGRIAQRRTRSGTIQRQTQVVQEEEEEEGGGEDTDMTIDQPEVESDINIESTDIPLMTSRDATSSQPWRRPPPWTSTRSDSTRTVTDMGTNPLSISMTDIGAGGDAQQTSSGNDDDFPPLPRSPQAAMSPRFPTSPSRTRGAISPPTTPSSHVRRTSFSRSQTGSVATATLSSSPTVNLSSRGRNRDGSISSSSSTGPQIAPAAPPLARRTSSNRRLSRSTSSQGPTTTAFTESGIAIMPKEDTFGPSSMTRPRLSTLTPLELASSAVSNTILPDLYERQSGPQDESDAEKEDLQRRLTWFRFNRPDPRKDLSRLRCTSRGRGCLFPGATFNGTQKSGRMSYDVTVQIVNVDMASSHLCGYLNIRGLTDDWPELTTYFDAEIIGMRFGFLTGKWGAQEADDMKHWSRFAPFRPLKNSLIKPGLRFNHMNKPFVFMRWKERFLVPDHRVRDINGASFAGFYYVCVELGEDEAGQPALMAPLSPTVGDSTSTPLPLPHHQVRARSASNRRRSTNVNTAAAVTEDRSAGVGSSIAASADTAAQGSALSEEDAAPHVVTMGRMSGFYFHEHSEPYQQLTLQHVMERSSSTFELR